MTSIVLYLCQAVVPRLFEIYTIAIFVYCLLSWVPGSENSAFGKFIVRICDPYISKFRRLPLQFAGLDLAPFVAILFLQFAEKGFYIVVKLVIFGTF